MECSSWSALGSGLAGTFRDSPVGAIAVSGKDVYVGGNFTTAGGVSANNIAKWDGTVWSALGSGMSDNFGVASAYVHSIHIDGNDVYVGGGFTQASNVVADGIAKWSGSSWAALGSGVRRGNAYGLAVVNNYLYVGGAFIRAGDKAANNIARYTLGTVASNTAPTITAATALTHQQGSTGTISTIATVNDAETAAGNLTVTAATIPTGITITNITNTNGFIAAQVTARCDALVGANTVVLNVSDGTATATANLIVNVSANTPPQPPLYSPPT